MAKAKPKAQIKKNHDINGVILAFIGILILFSIFFKNSAGFCGHIISKLLFTLIGIGAFMFPLIIIFIGICIIAKKGKIGFNSRFFGILLFFINTLLLIQLINLEKYYVNNNFFEGISLLFNSEANFHGGILSYIIDIPLQSLFGYTGSYVLFTAIYIISFILIFKFSFHDFFINIKNNKKSKKEKRTVHEEITDGNKLNFIKNINNKLKIIDFMRSSKGSEELIIKDNSHGAEKTNIEKTINNKSDKGITEKLEKEIEKELEKEIKINSTKTLMEYKIPDAEFLNINILNKLNKDDKRDLINNASRLEETLSSFGVEAKVVQVTKGPSVTRFELQPNAGVKVSKIVNLADDIALNLAASNVRIEAPIPGKSVVGIEVPNKELTPVFLKEIIESPEFINSKKGLVFSLGKDIGGNCVVSDLTKMPHVLIAGATGSGKSVCINTLIIGLLYKYSPEEVKLLMIDPKMVELSTYNGIPHLLVPVVTDPKKAAGALFWAVNEMTKRYKTFAENGVRNIESYNELVNKGKIFEKLPLIVIIIDELADLMMVCPNDVEDYIARLSQMARAAGMHLVIATQRPSVDVITGVIKANIPSRISFAVSSQIDSRTILDSAGAEKLLGKGDMLFYPVGEGKPIRVQGAFISEEEVEKVVSSIRDQKKDIDYKAEIIEEINISTEPKDSASDELFEEAVRIVIESKQASTSLLQRRLRIGYNRAARLIEELEESGIISQKDGSKPREILAVRNQES